MKVRYGVEAKEDRMSKANIAVTTSISSRLTALVGDGKFASEDAALSEALTLLEAKQARRAKKAAALMAAIQVGIDDIEAGRFETFDTPEALEAHVHKIWDEANYASSVAA